MLIIMLLAWIFGISALSIIISVASVWLILTKEWLVPNWRYVCTKVTSGDLAIELCRRCANKLAVNKCFKLYNSNMYCAICTAIVGTVKVDKITSYVISACKPVIIFFSLIFFAAVATIVGLL